MRFPAGILILAVGWLFAGCAGYHVGTTNGERAGERSIQVNFFKNSTPQPRLIEALNHSLRKALQQDGTYHLSTHGDADIIVNGEILKYDRPPLSYQPGDILTVRDYQLSITVHLTATERISGKKLVERDVRGTTTVTITLDQGSAERQALPLLADDFARQAKGLLVDGTW